MWWTISLLLGLFLAFYLYVKKRFSYFEKLGVPHQAGTFPLGSDCSWRMWTMKISFVHMVDEVCQEFPEAKVVGYYGAFGSPNWIIKDFELIKRVMVKDFDHFMDRRPFSMHPESNKYLSKMLTSRNGQEWKNERTLMSPMFTSGKLRNIMPTVQECSSDFVQHLRSVDKNELNAKEVMNLATCEILGRIGCGVKPNIWEDPPNNVFYKQMKTLIGQGGGALTMIKVMIIIFFPTLAYYSKASFIPEETMNFFANIIRDQIKSRKLSQTKMNDFIDFWVEVWENNDDKNEMEAESEFEKNAQIKGANLSKLSDQEFEDIVIANGILVFFAGNDTTSTGMALVLFFLANHPEVQEKMYQEIQEAIEDNGGSPDLDYNALHGLKYMEKVVKESFRCWGANFIERSCTKDYQVPGTHITIPKDAMVQLAGNYIMQNEEFYSDPNEFNPDAHFDSDVLMPSSFYAFGQGPRNCIGMRFAWTIMRALLVKICANYKVLPTPGMPKKMIIDPANPQALPKGGVKVKLEDR